MKEFAKRFYSSAAWQRRRDAYKQETGGLCERCLRKGLIVPGEIVHHKVPLTPENISDAEITLGKNLELLCRECHAAEHETRSGRRFQVDSFGRVTAREPPPFEEIGGHLSHRCDGAQKNILRKATK